MTPTLSMIYRRQFAKNPHGRNREPELGILPKRAGNRHFRRMVAAIVRREGPAGLERLMQGIGA